MSRPWDTPTQPKRTSRPAIPVPLGAQAQPERKRRPAKHVMTPAPVWNQATDLSTTGGQGGAPSWEGRTRRYARQGRQGNSGQAGEDLLDDGAGVALAGYDKVGTFSEVLHEEPVPRLKPSVLQKLSNR